MKKQRLYTEISKLNSEHTLYFIKMENDNEVFCKVGVTSQTVEERMSWEDNYGFTLIDSITSDGYTIRGLESVLKERVLDYEKHYQPKRRIGGYSECYDISYLEEIKQAFKYLKKKTHNKKVIVQKDVKVEVPIFIEKEVVIKTKDYYELQIKSLKDQINFLEDRLNYFEPELDISTINDLFDFEDEK